jgi:DNA-binding MarR family transcriptional regulator
MSKADVMGARSSERSKQTLRCWLHMLSSVTLIEQRLRGKLRQAFQITLPQFDILAELERAAQPQTMTELSRRLMVSNGNVTGVVDRLELAGLVRREVSPTDRRVLFIGLTPKGKDAFGDMAIAHEKWVGEMLADLAPSEVSALSEHLISAKRSIRNLSPGDTDE